MIEQHGTGIKRGAHSRRLAASAALYSADDLRALALFSCRQVGHNRDHLADALEWCAVELERVTHERV